MQEIKLQGLDESIFYDKCDNGLEIYVWSNPKVNTFKATMTFLVGGEDVEFYLGPKKYSVPFGTAHYLEHMLCKKDDGTSLLQEYQKLGSYNNAYTNAYRTVFEVVGTTNFYENLSLLLESYQNKEFLLENIELERNVILEEARMVMDKPNRIMGEELNRLLFHKYPNRVSLVGTIEDIEKISKDDLETLYNSFYHPKNSFVTVTGNVDPLEVIHFIKENQKKKDFEAFNKPKLKQYREPKSIVKTYHEIETNIEVPKVLVAVKIPKKLFSSYDVLDVLNSLQFILSTNFGASSILRDELMEKKLIVQLSSFVTLERNYFIIHVQAKTKFPEEVIPILKNKLKHLKIIKKDIERKIKSDIANLVLSYEDPVDVNDGICYTISKFHKIYDNEKEMLENLNMNKIKTIFSKVSIKEIVTLVSMPKTKDEN